MITTATPETKTPTQEFIEYTEIFGTPNYKPLPVVISEAKGVWVKNPEGCKYLDMLSSYSALNHGHRHPAIIKALIDQAKKVTLVSRAFHSDQLGLFLKELSDLTGFGRSLPMNSGTEAVETAIKTARKWGYIKKGLPQGQAEIIVAANNFHGRTVTIVSFSTDEQYRKDFGPLTPGFKVVPFGDAEAIKSAITPNTVAFLVEPIQAEAGILMPPPGYFQKVREICTRNNVLFMLDEIQTGMGRTGKMFAFEHEGVRPDVLILGKALGGGAMPVSAVCASSEILGVYQPGDHGSTFGGNPLACAVARAAIRILKEENLVERSAQMGEYLMNKLRTLKSGYIKEIRGRGLLIGIELHAAAGGARRFCEALMHRGVLCKETHEHVIRLAPPLVITEKEIDWAFSRLKKVLGT